MSISGIVLQINGKLKFWGYNTCSFMSISGIVLQINGKLKFWPYTSHTFFVTLIRDYFSYKAEILEVHNGFIHHERKKLPFVNIQKVFPCPKDIYQFIFV